MNILNVLRVVLAFLAISSSAYAKYDLTICTIFQNEAPYFKEWIEFHKLQGVQHFYLYNNNSNDDYLDALAPYINNNEVTLVEWPYTYQEGDHAHWIRIQSSANMDCITNFGEETAWLASIDVDEFLYCPNGDTLTNFLQGYLDFAAVCVNWVKFGTSHIYDIPSDKLMIELLTLCTNKKDPHNRFIKSIVQPQYVIDCKSAHYFIYKDEMFPVDTNKTRIAKPKTNFSQSILLDKARINHYWTRTEKYFKETKIPSRQKRRSHHQFEKLLLDAEKCNEFQDTTILQFADRLREAMGLRTDHSTVFVK